MTETPSGDHRGAEQGAGDGADAEAGVEPRQDRASEALLHERSLDVHRHVPDAVADAQQEEADDDRRDADAVAERRDREADAAEHAMTVIVRAAPSRATTIPASGSATSEPAAIASSSRPRLSGSV